MEKYIELLKAGGADLALVIDPATVVTEPWVEFKCRYGCPRYGKSYCCPPHSPDYKRTREILDSFRRALLFRCHSMDGGTPLALSVGKALAVVWPLGRTTGLGGGEAFSGVPAPTAAASAERARPGVAPAGTP